MSLFNYSTGNPNNLIAGGGAAMSDIQGPFVDLRAFINGGNFDATNLANGAVTPPKISSWPKARAFHNANVNIPSASTTTVALNSESYDTDSMHDTITNNSRLTIKTAGKYMIGGTIEFAGGASGTYRKLFLVANSVNVLDADTKPPIGAQPVQLRVTTVADLAVNDIVELQVNQDTGSNLQLTGVSGATVYSPVFWAHWIGA